MEWNPPGKRRREIDDIEDEVLAKEARHYAPREEAYVKNLQDIAKQSLTDDEKKQALEDLKAAAAADEERSKREAEAEEQAWDVDVLRQQFESGGMRRQWNDGPLKLNFALDDNNIEAERLTVTPAESSVITCAEDEERWCWKLAGNKGLVVLYHPSGEVRCQGQWTHQLVLQNMLSKFTAPWEGWTPRGPNEHDQDSLAYQQFFEHGGIKRVYFGSPDDLKADLDMAQGDADSSLVEMAAKAPGVQYWLWRNKRLKGAIKLTTPSGEVVCQGNFKQQVALYGLLKTCAG